MSKIRYVASSLLDDVTFPGLGYGAGQGSPTSAEGQAKTQEWLRKSAQLRHLWQLTWQMSISNSSLQSRACTRWRDHRPRGETIRVEQLGSAHAVCKRRAVVAPQLSSDLSVVGPGYPAGPARVHTSNILYLLSDYMYRMHCHEAVHKAQ